MFVTNWNSTTKIQKISEITNFFRHYFLSRTEVKFITNAELHMGDFENCRILRNVLETSDVTGGGVSLFLYQSGYLTIKDSDEFGYVLGFPNKEVRQALKGLLDWKIAKE